MSGGATRAATALGLLAVCFVAFFLGIGRIALVEKDEPRYAGTAREMVRSGDWLVPRFNGQERLVKPPLVYWAIAASFRAAGRAEEGPARGSRSTRRSRRARRTRTTCVTWSGRSTGWTAAPTASSWSAWASTPTSTIPWATSR